MVCIRCNHIRRKIQRHGLGEKTYCFALIMSVDKFNSLPLVKKGSKYLLKSALQAEEPLQALYGNLSTNYKVHALKCILCFNCKSTTKKVISLGINQTELMTEHNIF